MRKNEALLTRYVEQCINEESQRYNNAEVDESAVTVLMGNLDEIFYEFRHKVGLSKEFLVNLKTKALSDIRDLFCPEFHALNSIEHVKENDKGCVYVVENEHGKVKIGKSISPLKRIKNIETIGGNKITRKWISQKTQFFNKIETQAHRMFSKDRIAGEWFDLDFEATTKTISSLVMTSTNQ